MTRDQLAHEIALGLINTHVEGGYDAVSCSTNGDYPSLGCSQWEGPRGDDLLSRIPGGDAYAGRRYSELDNCNALDGLSDLLASDAGVAAQREKLAEDCLRYVDLMQTVSTLDTSRGLMYCAMWCPTSESTVHVFTQNRENRGFDLRDLSVLRDVFYNEYAHAAGCDNYAESYQNRAITTYDYVANLDLSQYGE